MTRRLLVLLLPTLLGLDWGWTKGEAPLDLSGAPSAASCAGCHADQHASWAASNHKAAWHNDLMLVGYAVEPMDFCVHCHAPRPEQKAEILVNRDFYRSLDPRSDVPVGSVDRIAEPHAADGVDCAACHWRDGAIVAAERSYAAPHRVVESEALASGEMCIGCHDFPMPATVDGHLGLTDVPMQRTGGEWREWRAAGGQETCVDCHMPGGDHRVRGVHDRELLRASFAVDARWTEDGVRFSVASVGVGHHLPSGDLFRHATLEVRTGDASWRTVQRFGRTFQVRADPDDGRPRKELVADTALRPGVPVIVELDLGQDALEWRLVWHDASENDEARGLLDLQAITSIVAEGRLRR